MKHFLLASLLAAVGFYAAPAFADCESAFQGSESHPTPENVGPAVQACTQEYTNACAKLDDGTGDGRYAAALCVARVLHTAAADVAPDSQEDAGPKCEAAYKKATGSISVGDVQDAVEACSDDIKSSCAQSSQAVFCPAQAAHTAFKNTAVKANSMYCGTWQPERDMHDHMYLKNGGMVKDGKYNVHIAYDNGTDNDPALNKEFDKTPKGKCVCYKGDVSYRSNEFLFDYVCASYTCGAHKTLLKGNCNVRPQPEAPVSVPVPAGQGEAGPGVPAEQPTTIGVSPAT